MEETMTPEPHVEVSKIKINDAYKFAELYAIAKHGNARK